MSKPTRATATREIGLPVNYAFGGGRTELVPALSGINGLMQLQQMWELDETLGAMAWVIESTLSQVEWTHTPMKDGKEAPSDPEAKRYADFADQCLVDMTHSFSDHVDEASTMIPLGFAPCEIVLKQRTADNSRFPDGFYGFDKLPLRDQHSVTEFTYTDPRSRELKGMVQHAEGAAEIPIWKLLHYRTNKRLNNPYGRSLLIPAYRPWYLKRRIQDSEAVGIDRELAGMPTFSVPISDIKASQKTDRDGKPTKEAMEAIARIQGAIKAVRDMRFNEAGGLVIPSDPFKDADGKPGQIRQYEFKLITGAGQRAIDARTAAKDYDRSIARALLFQFLHLGDRSGGSYALSDNQSDLALRSLRAITIKIRDEYQLKALPFLWFVNNFPLRYMPRLEPSPIAEDGIEQIGLFLQRIADAEPIYAERPDVLEAVLNRAGLAQARRRVHSGELDAMERQREATAAARVVRDVMNRGQGDGASAEG